MPFIENDRVWGPVCVSDPCLVELAQSRPVQRLRDIHQAGASYYLLPGLRPVTRYEHSIGVMHLLERLGAGHEEQVAGLLHDVPHTAFSHTADIVFPNSEHNFHERHHSRVVMGSEIPGIAARYGLPERTITSQEIYPMLEQPLPRLCADRIDYTLRDMVVLNEVSPVQASEFAGRLTGGPEGITVDTVEAALWFAGLFARANDMLYTNVADAGAYWALAGAIRRAIDARVFSEADLFLADDAAMSILRSCNDAIVQAYLSLLTPGTIFYRVTGDDSGPAFTTHMKQRVVDPLVKASGMSRALPLSELSATYKARLNELPPNGSAHYRLWTANMPPVLAAILAGTA